ncbi:hypothetical protein B0H21DRAFT_859868 [Amylocystis lapponica]|nr:hypothetical protein B0H21DRAFT_859868 [Amylocystis lapponica]
MVSALWKACSEGDLENVLELLNGASSVDIEIKDHTGGTPLIEAVKSGNVEIVRALLDRGADPTNASSQGPPEQYTADPYILELLNAAKSKMFQSTVPVQEPPFPHDPNMDPSKYYGPPSAYYYPGMPMPPPMLPEGASVYYPPPPPAATEQNPSGMPNLPPPEVARMIPCRYYPACRYGSACIFAHPQSPYLQGPLPPPAQYPAPYDPMAPPPYPPTYYAPSFSPSPNGPSVNPMSPSAGPPPLPHPQMTNGTDVMSPIQAPFSPTGAPHMPYGVPAMSPTYGHPSQVPVPISIPPLPPLQHPASGGPQSPQRGIYSPMSPGAHGAMPPYADPAGQYMHPGMSLNGHVAETIGSPRSPPGHPQADVYGPPPVNREGMGHHRRGSARRPPFGPGRKPPCLFFPAGRCRNGDECRFPHIMPDGPMPHQPPHFSARGGHRRIPTYGNGGIATIEEKFQTMTVQDDRQSLGHNGINGTNGTADSSRSQSTEPGSRSRSQGFKPNHGSNGSRAEKKFPSKPQRVPNADEFPVLASTTPPLRSPGLNGPTSGMYSGPTAAQVLQAPPPRKDLQPGFHASAPDQVLSQGSKDGKVEVIGATPLQDPAVSKLPISFAAATVAPDATKEVSVSA